MDYSVQFTREAIFKAAKTNTGGNFLILLGIWAITPKSDAFKFYFCPISLVISIMTILILYLGFTFKSDLSERKQKNYEYAYFVFTIIISFSFGALLFFKGYFFGFLSTPHLGTWVFIVAITEALASYMYHRPKLFMINYLCLNIVSIIWLFTLSTTAAISIAVTVILYGPILYMRTLELTKLKDQTVNLLKESKNRQEHLQTFLDLIPAKITWLDSNLRYIGINRQFKDSNKLSLVNDILGRKFGEKTPDAVITKEVNSFLLSENKSKHCELLIDVAGEMRWHLCHFSKEEFSHGKEIFLITLDIQEQKKIQEELENQRSISDQASKFASLGEMAAGIAHEINNPLTIIQGSSLLLKNLVDKDKLSPDLLNKHLDKIIDTNTRIVNIIKGMKDFSRNQDNSSMNYEKISSIVDTTLLFCTEKFKNNNISLVIDNIDSEATCLCKPQQINQILLNFLNNAFDAVLENKDKKIIKIYIEPNKEFHVLCVADTGVGIADLEKIFTPYFTTKAPGKGTGIGLSISQKIAHSHNGFIEAAREDKFTVLKLYLPIVSSPD